MTLKPARVHFQGAFITHATAEVWVDAAGATIGYHVRENHDIVRRAFASSVLCLANDAAPTVIVAWIWIDAEVGGEARAVSSLCPVLRTRMGPCHAVIVCS
jgi:hypothetical protein